nr:ribonuclease H-like domain-containing protein [Tanacetum cinerariifolium]
MESQPKTTQTISALKLPLLKIREYDLWSMRMKQYLTFTDHALWEVIVNFDSVTLVSSASGGAESPISPKTAEQKLARKNELKAKSTLMLAILDEHILKFNACKNAKSLWEAIQKSQEELDKTYDRFQKLISQLEIHGEVISQEDANLKLLRSLPSAWNNIALILRNKSDLNTLSMVDLYNNLRVRTIECYNCHRRGHFAKECRAPRNQENRNKDAPKRNAQMDTSTTNALVVQDRICGYDWNFQAEEDLTNFALMAYTSQGSSSSDSELGNALKEKDDLKQKIDRFETSSKNLTKMINSQISANDKIGLGYNGKLNESVLNDIHVNGSEVLNNVVDSVFDSSESDKDNDIDRFKKSEGYHAVPPPYTGNYMPPKADLSFAGLDDSVFKSKVSETTTSVPKIETNASKLVRIVWKNLKLLVPVNATKQSSLRAASSVSTAKGVNTVAPRSYVNDALPKTYSKFKAHSQDQGIFDSGCSRHMTGNKSYLIDYQEIDGGFDETPEILKNFITGIENQIDHKVKIIRCDNRAEFKNRIKNKFCKMKGIRREFSVARTPQQNVSTACYVQNRVLVIKPYNKTPYELLLGRKPALSFMRPFRYPVTILNTLDHLGNQTNGNACTKANFDAGQTKIEIVSGLQYVLLPLFTFDSQGPTNSKDEVGDNAGKKCTEVLRQKNGAQNLATQGDKDGQEKNEEKEPKRMSLKDTGIFSGAYDDGVEGAVADINNLKLTSQLSMIGSLMYLTASRPDIMFVVCACARFQVTPKISHLHAVKRIFIYLKGQPKLGLWYPKDSPFDLEAFSGSDYADHNVDDLLTKAFDTATVRTIDSGEQKITTTVEGKDFTVTEASVRRHLELADAEEEGEGLRHPSEPQPPPSTAQPTHTEPIPIVASSSHQKTQTPRQALQQVTELPQISEPIPYVADKAVYEEWDDIVKRATTTAASLDAAQASVPRSHMGSIAQTRSEGVPTQPYDSPLPIVNTLGSDEDSLTLKELTVLCTTLLQNVESLEADLKHTKPVYEAAYTKLILKVKKLEKTVKTSKARRTVKIVVSNDEKDLEDPSKQGRSMIEEIHQDSKVTLVTPTQVLADATKVHTYTKRRRAVSTGNGGISTASKIISTAKESVSTTGASMSVSTAGMIDKDKGIMEESKLVKTKTKRQQKQERIALETTVRLQEQFDEEERQRIARFHEVAQTFTEEEWENIIVRVKADEELTQRLQAEEREKYSEDDRAKMLVDLINQRKKYFATKRELFEATMRSIQDLFQLESEGDKVAPKLAETKSLKRDAEEELDQGSSKKQKTSEASRSTQEQPVEKEKELSQEDLQQLMIIVPEDDLVMLRSLVKEKFNSTEPTDDKERKLWVEMKRLFEQDTNDELWESQKVKTAAWKITNVEEDKDV